VQACETRREPIPGGSSKTSLFSKVSQACTRYRHLRGEIRGVLSGSENF